MNKKIYFIYLLMAALVIFGLSSCSSNNESNSKNSLKNSLDWEGIYTGSYMTDGGKVLNVRIRLNKEQTFEANYQYADGYYNTIDINGRFQWDNSGSIIMIDVIDSPIHYKVARNKLIRLDNRNLVLEKIH